MPSLELLEMPHKEEIKKSYKRLALKHHPDRGGNAEIVVLIFGSHN